MSRTARWWTIAAGLLVIIVLTVHLALPGVLHTLIVRQLAGLTGEPASIGAVEVNLFTRHLVLRDVRLGGENDQEIARLGRLDARFALPPLLRAHLRLSDATVDGLVVHIVRDEIGDLNITPALERLATPSPGDPRYDLTILDGWIRDARVTVDDRALAPPRTWQAADIHIALDRVSTLAAASGGRAWAVGTLEGAPARIEAEDVRLRPLHLRALARATGLDASLAGVYMAAAGTPVVITAGRSTGSWDLVYDGVEGVRGDGRASLAGFVLEWAETAAPVFTAPLMTFAAEGVEYRDGVVRARRMDVLSEPTTVFDPVADEPVPFDLGEVRAVVENIAFPSAAPADVALTGGLPEGGQIDIRGQATIEPVSVDVTVLVRDSEPAPFRHYLPADAPVTFQGGRLAADVDLRYDVADGLRAEGALTVRDLDLYRRGHTEPFIRHRQLEADIRGLRLLEGALSIERLAMTGAPVILDASVSPTQRYELQALSLVVEGAGWPWPERALVSGEARLDPRGAARLRGELTFEPFAAAVRLDASDLDVSVVNAYLGDDPPAVFQDGRLDAVVDLQYAADTVVIGAQGTATAVAIARPDDTAPFFEAPELALSVGELRIQGGDFTAATVVAEGAPTLRDPDTGRAVPFRQVRAELQDLAWPGQTAVAVLDADLAEGGTLTARGNVDLRGQTFSARAEIVNAALAPLGGFIPGPAGLDGRLWATLALRGTLGDFRIAAQGDVLARSVSIGPVERPPIAVSEIAATGLDVSWPERFHVEEIVVRAPSVLIERMEEGDFPVVALFRPEEQDDDDVPAASPATEEEPRTVRIPEPAFELVIGRIVVEDGDVRFVDRTTQPFYSEELTNLHITVDRLATDEGHAHVRIDGLLGVDAILNLEGVVAPYAEPFFLEVEGELTRFQVPRTNPYLRRLFEAVARRGQLTTALHYRVVGRELEGTNEIYIQQLDVERARAQDVDRVIGLPLALVVSLLRNPQGDIRLTIPVAGDIGSPRFSFGDAIRTALQSTLARAVTAPFRGIARVFQREDGVVEELAIEPVMFPAGDAAIVPETARQLQRVADFLRASPFIRLALQSVVTEDDHVALRARSVSAEIVRLQREEGIESFTAAAMRLFRERYPERPVPADAARLVAALAQDEPMPEALAMRLAERRASEIQQMLVVDAGIDAGQLVVREPMVDAVGDGRVEFEILPEG